MKYFVAGCPTCGRVWQSTHAPLQQLSSHYGLCRGGTGSQKYPMTGDEIGPIAEHVTSMYIVYMHDQPLAVRSHQYREVNGPITTLLPADEHARLWALAKLFHSNSTE